MIETHFIPGKEIDFPEKHAKYPTPTLFPGSSIQFKASAG